MTELKILLASASTLKTNAVKNYFDKYYPSIKINIDFLNCDPCGLPPQPIACGSECTAARLAYAVASYTKIYDIAMAIESVLEKNHDGKYYDCVYVRVMANGILGNGASIICNDPGEISMAYLCPVEPAELESQPEIIYSDKIRGYKITGGEILSKKNGCNPKNWMLDMGIGDRVTQITVIIKLAMENLMNNITNCYNISSSYKIYSDFPKVGVDFKYFYSLFVKSANLKLLSGILASKYMGCEIDAVIPLESRGLVLGAVLADRLEAAMIPMQKPGKIPGEKITIQYGKEYGMDEIQFSCELFEMLLSNKKKCYHFLIVDDLLATGGSIQAAINIIKKLAEKYAINYKISVFAVEDVAPLRKQANIAIGMQYDILFRDIESAYNRMKQLLLPES